MRIIVTPAAAGKTTELIKEAAAAPGHVYIVCFSRMEADRVFKESKKMGLRINLPITWAEFITGTHNTDAVFIDNLDLCLGRLARCPIKTVTMTGSPEALPSVGESNE